MSWRQTRLHRCMRGDPLLESNVGRNPRWSRDPASVFDGGGIMPHQGGRMGPDKRDLYRFPWSLNDNPIGWLEVTDACNLHCRGCYRQSLEGHKSLDQLKEEVLFLKRWRNCDNISVAGGEALLHPEIVETVGFIAHQGMKSFILSNGMALNRHLLDDLKEAGPRQTGFLQIVQ